MVEEPEPGVVSAPVDALAFLTFGLGQGLTPGFEFGHESVELVAGHAGQGGMGEQVSALSRDRGRLRLLRLGWWRRAGIVGRDRVVPLAVEVVTLDALQEYLALLLGEGAAGGVVALVQDGADGQAGNRRRPAPNLAPTLPSLRRVGIGPFTGGQHVVTHDLGQRVVDS